MKRSRNAFRAWIKRVGRIEVARLLGVTPMAVTHWKQGSSLPKVSQMRKIKKLSRGQVTYADMVEGIR